MGLQQAIDAYREWTGADPVWIASAPGRVNLIGEHTDYNSGFVLPAAIDRRTWVAAGPAEGRTEITSTCIADSASFDANTVKPVDVQGWGAYPAGVAWAIREAGLLPNIRATISSDLPIGAGLSSSAALEMAFGSLWNLAGSLGLTNQETALLCRRAENLFVGVLCGVMDQMSAALGRKGFAILLDTRAITVEHVPIPEGVAIVVCHTGKPRSLSATAYNDRRAECDYACRILGVGALRDADEDLLAARREQMPDAVYRRARHVIAENRRVISMAKALEESHWAEIGRLMTEGHASLRDDFEVTGPELDAMQKAASESPGCIGARMTGAGFGGACVALVRKHSTAEFTRAAAAAYRSLRVGLEPEFIVCAAEDAATAREFGGE